MTIHYTKLTGDIGTIGHSILILDYESWKQFQILVNRATNTWPDAPPEIKTFADQITNDGVVLQDYASQDTSKKQRPDDLNWGLTADQIPNEN